MGITELEPILTGPTRLSASNTRPSRCRRPGQGTQGKGLSASDIGKMLGVPRATVYRYLLLAIRRTWQPRPPKAES